LNAVRFGVLVSYLKKAALMMFGFIGRKISDMKKKRSLIAACCSLVFLTASLSAATVAKPTLTIVNLKSGQRLSNDVFTVQGTAKSSVGISNVLYSLNQGEWQSVDDTPNEWTNWLAEINLIPGTNTFSVYAIGNNGVLSATDTLKFVYVVMWPLTVLTNGNGTIKPAYNGVPLQIGTAYSMTATAAKGSPSSYGLRNWTDASNNIVGTSATLKFTMSSNLTLIANFGDIRRPVISLKSTTTNSDGYPADFVVHGTASDALGVTNVFYQLNTGGWQVASTTNNWTNWVADVRLQPGANNFYAYAVNVNTNSAPASLAGKVATVSFSSTNFAPLTVAFGKSTFSQTTQDTNNVNGVGTYTYRGSGGGGSLSFKYTGPPSAASKTSYNLGLSFVTPGFAYFTNTTAKNTGYMQFTPVANLPFASAAGQFIVSVGSAGDGDGILFQKNSYSSTALSSAVTNYGTYTYTQYSPVGSLIKLTSTNGTDYVLASFAGTNYGAYYEEDYNHAGQTNGTDTGRFLVYSQKPGGNAPLAVTNLNFEFFSSTDTFNVQFGADTYSQDSLSTNFDNAVGSYTYDRATTNIAQLDLTVIAPPVDAASNVLAGSTDNARLIFVGPNVGLLTNADGTFTTFATTTATNFAPASLTNSTLSFSTFYSMQFGTNGGFVYNAFFNTYSGNYTYTPYSPGGAMLQLTYLDTSNNITALQWLQLNFKATNSGNVYWNQFDAETNYLGNYSGAFSLH
jgi:hypothetical protein